MMLSSSSETLLADNTKLKHGMHFSLDFADNRRRYHPFQQFSYWPANVHGTNLLFRADYLLKQFSMGYVVNNRPPLHTRPCSTDDLCNGSPEHIIHGLQRINQRGTISSLSRLWNEADELSIKIKHIKGRQVNLAHETDQRVKCRMLEPDASGIYIDAPVDEPDRNISLVEDLINLNVKIAEYLIDIYYFQHVIEHSLTEERNFIIMMLNNSGAMTTTQQMVWESNKHQSSLGTHSADELIHEFTNCVKRQGNMNSCDDIMIYPETAFPKLYLTNDSRLQVPECNIVSERIGPLTCLKLLYLQFECTLRSIFSSTSTVKQYPKSSLRSSKTIFVIELSLVLLALWCSGVNSCHPGSDEITVSPMNEALTVGMKATFIYRSNASLCGVYWSYDQPGQIDDTYSHNDLELVSNHRYIMNRTLPGQCDLIIPQITYNDGGMYTVFQGDISKSAAFLNVMDSPVCSTDYTKLDELTLTCTIVYTGFLKPYMEWSRFDHIYPCVTSLSTLATKTIASCSVTIVGAHVMLETHFACSVYFISSDTVEHSNLLEKAINIPSFSESCEISVIPFEQITNKHEYTDSQTHATTDRQLLVVVALSVTFGVFCTSSLMCLIFAIILARKNRLRRHLQVS